MLQDLEAVVSRSWVLSRSQIKFTAKFEALRTTCILIDLDNITSMQMTKHGSASLVFLFEVLAVDRNAMCRTSPDANIELLEACPVSALLGELLDCLRTVAARRIPKDDEGSLRNASVTTLIVHDRVVGESAP